MEKPRWEKEKQMENYIQWKEHHQKIRKYKEPVENSRFGDGH
jgi:hypothetical protein